MKRIRPVLYDGLSVLLLAGSLYFYYQATSFLCQKDYVASLIALVIGFLTSKASVDLARIAIFVENPNPKR